VKNKSNSSSTPPITTQAIILGLGSMFNHSTLNQNVGWERDLCNLLITYISLRDIRAGEELCISYGPRLTFKDVDAEELERDPDDWTEVLNIIDLID
jgi:SET domain-containing protein